MNPSQLFPFLKSLTVVIPLAIVLIRFDRIDRSYQPFVIYLLIGFITEVVTFIYIAGDLKKNNAPISNTYVLIEWLLIVWQFYRWGFLRTPRQKLYLIIIFVVAVWITENFIYGNFTKHFGPYFRMLSAFTIVLMSVTIINYTIINDNKNIFRNARFLICIGFMIFFIYKLIYEAAYNIGHEELKVPATVIVTAFGYVNAFQKLLCAVAAFYIPERNDFEIKLDRNYRGYGNYNG